MNRNLLVTIIVIVIIIAAGAYLFLNQSKVAPQDTQTQFPAVSPSIASEKTSLKSFMAMSGTKKCEFTDAEKGSSGTIYLDSGKMRGDFSSEINNKVTSSHMINDGQDIYIWMDDQPTGFKTTLSAIEAVSGTTGISQTVDINKQLDYKCGSWNAQKDKFAWPADKTFNDMTKMMQDSAKMMQTASPGASVSGENSESCSACDSLEGSAKTQCKAALKCS